MHSVCADLFNEKKCILEEGGVAELEKTASGGQDIATLLSGFLLCNSRLPFFLIQYVLLSPHTTVQANQVADKYNRMSDESVIANMWFVPSLRFFSAYVQMSNALSCSGAVLAGQDTTASSLTRLMCMMPENPDLQACLHKEILDARAVSPPFFSFSAFENVMMMYFQG